MSQQITQQLTKILAYLAQFQKANSTNIPPTISPIIKKPQVLKFPRAPNMTYFQYLSKVLKDKASQSLQIPSLSKKASYRLHQDLQILLELANHKTITMKIFEELSQKGKIFRSPQSIKARYHDYLSKIQEKDMKKIVQYVQAEGAQGYIVFQNDEIKIGKIDPRQNQKQISYKRPRNDSLQKEEKKLEKQIRKTVPNNCSELNQILSIYSKMVNVPITFLLQKLDALSGDLVALDNYIQTKDNKLLWTEQQDKILREGGLQLQILQKYRGRRDIEIRKKYLGLN